MKNKLIFLFMAMGIAAQAQNLSVTGKVMYWDGKPYTGVKVNMVGVDQDVASSSGEFRINIPASFKVRVGDKIQLFIEEPNKNTVEYSVIIPNNPGLNPVIIKLNTKSQSSKQTELQMLSVAVADFYEEPYGQAFYEENGKIVRVRALPEYEHEIHNSPLTSNTLLTPIGDAIREAYKVVLFNNSSAEKYLISDIKMKVIKNVPLPDKYVINWKRKGIKKSMMVDVQLMPEKAIYTSMKSDEYLDLSPGESQIVQFNLKGGAPGIYTLQFEVDILNKSGTYSKLVFPGKFEILIPDRAIKTGVLLFSQYPQEALSLRILHMDEQSYESVVKGSNPGSIAINDIFKPDQVTAMTDSELVEYFVKKK